MRTKARMAAAFVAAALLTGAPVVQAQQSTLAAARDLYASAAYEDALAALNNLTTAGDPAVDSGAASLYRALCLYALGKNAEGDQAIAALVTQHPLYRPPTDDLSPRMRTTVSDTRRRVLPGVLQQKYSEAKAAYDRKDFKAASTGFSLVLDGLADPDLSAVAGQSPLADLGTLATGFRDLSVKALTPPPVPVIAATPPTVLSAPVTPRIYTAEDEGVVAPVAIRQAIPPYSRAVTQRKTAIVQLVVTETGSVESASMLTPLDPQYDRVVVNAARSWQYQPAKVEGVPVKFQKRVQITLVPGAR